jgi:hypothetical protein
MPISRAEALAEFTKTKMHFALALLATLFALHPFVEKFGDNGFEYEVGQWRPPVELKIFYAYGLIAALLALTVYFYALSLLSERGYSWMEKAGNYIYAIAIMILPLYGALFLSQQLAELVKDKVAVPAAAITFITLGLGVLWLVVSYLLARRLRKRLAEQDRSSKIDQLAEQEIAALNHAQELFTNNHYDLSVIEAWKAIEARLRRVLLMRGVSGQADDPQAMIHTASRAHLLSKPSLELLQELRRQWNIAVSTDPLTRDAAAGALTATRNILATIQLDDPKSKSKPAI